MNEPRTHWAAYPPLPVPHEIDPCGNELYTRQQLLDFGLMCLKQQSMFEEMERRGL